jgi:hypothetical protein
MRRTPAVLALVLPLLGAAACGDKQDVVIEATPQGVAKASQATLDAGTARYEVTVSFDLSALGLGSDGASELTGEGVIDFAAQRSELTLDFSSLFEGAGDDVPPALGAAFEGGIRTVQDGTDVYTCAAFFTQLAGNECVHIDTTAITGSSALGGNSADPMAMLRSLAGADLVEEIGTEEVVGVETTHLSGSATIREAAAALDPDAAADLAAAYERLGLSDEALDTPIQFDIWVDGDGLVRQVRETFDVGSITGDASGGDSTFELRFPEFGVDADIEIPTDAAELSDVPGLDGLLGG